MLYRPLPLWVKISYTLLSVLLILLTFLSYGTYAFLSGAFYLTTVTFTTSLTKRNKFDVFVVDLLFLWGFIGMAWKGDTAITIIIREHMIFTFPMSFFIYILLTNWKKIKQKMFLLLYPEAFSFLCMELLFFSYGVMISIRNPQPQYDLSAFLLLLLLGGLYYTIINLHLKKNMIILRSKLDLWFSEKWELALSEHTHTFSWSNLDTQIQAILSNDGLMIFNSDLLLYSSGYFKEIKPTQSRCVIPSSGTISLSIHRTSTYHSFSIPSFYMAFALSQYFNEKMEQWNVLQTLNLTQNDGSYSKDLQFRKDVTYYLHDNVLQNIIATKNIVSTLQTEKSALQDLAVETLSELNDSIRSQMHDIYPSTLEDLPFERNIYILINELQRKFVQLPSIHVEYTILENIPDDYKYFFYRGIQELLTNACKHGDAKNIWITMATNDLDRSFFLEISHDGKPLPNNIGETKIKHLGLSSLIHQAAAFKGQFQISEKHNKRIFKIILPRSLNENTFI